MPPVFVMPVPECHHQEHRHPPAKDSRVENVMRAASSPNFFETLDLLWGHWPAHLQPPLDLLPQLFDHDQRRPFQSTEDRCALGVKIQSRNAGEVKSWCVAYSET
jgi:hypothetical protein